ncbi:MAG: NADH-quinone oxidoreductase subunit NuoN [Cuniculiplasma sp.]
MTFFLYSNILESLYPEIFLGFVAFGMLLMGRRVKNWMVYTTISIMALLISMILLILLDSGSQSFFGGAFVINNFGLYFALILITSSLYVSFTAGSELKHDPEIFFSIFLFVNIAMIIAAFSLNLIFIFIAFEGISVGTYILSAHGKTRRNLEASIKYFFTGVIATGFIVFGSSFYYLSTGTFNLVSVANAADIAKPSMLLALILLFVGFGFKLALVPLQQWAVDTYDGTKNPVSAFLSSGTKVLAFLIILRVFLVGFASMRTDVFYLFTIVSIITMTYGNFAALSENNLKRMLAYSSIAQAGYLILVLTVVSGSTSQFAFTVAIFAAMYYSLVYIFMKGGAFMATGAVNKEKVEINDLSGIGLKSPAFAISLGIMMLALAGIPPTAGFFAKYYLFLSLISGNLWYLAVIGILNSAISVFYYLRVIVVMFRPSSEEREFNLSNSILLPVIIGAVMSIGLSFLIFGYPYLSGIVAGLGVGA